jgi:hypothetical protein
MTGRNGVRFTLVVWALSRILVFGAILLATRHPAAALAHWDGAWYRSIALHGYSYAPDGHQHNLAFFPLFPLLAWPLVRLGFPWALAAGVIANTAFLAALFVLYALSARCFDERSARWSVATACALPPSLFCSVDYPQSCFMLASGAALYLALRRRFIVAGLCAAFASAASGLGIALAAAMLVRGLAMKRRSVPMVLGGVLAFGGVGAFALYCAVRFGNPFAFVQAQHAWRQGFGFDWSAWRSIAGSLVTLRGLRQNVMMLLLPIGAVAVALSARRLGTTMTIYGLGGLAVLAFSGIPFSVDRNAYAVVPVVIAIAHVLRRVPLLGWVVLGASALLLAVDAAAFARFQWVA